MRRWIARSDSIKIGTIGYLVETVVTGKTSWTLHDQPVGGWFGVGKVVRFDKTRRRAQVLQLQGAERDAFLRAVARSVAA